MEQIMKFIGITGGVGAGKTQILSFLAKQPGVRVMLADEIAHELMEPQTECFKRLQAEFAGEDLYQPDGSFDRQKLAAVLFSDQKKRERLNAIVHPAVREYVIQQKNLEKQKREISLLVLEAALLIEEHYDEICDELWYIYTSRENRRERLKASRGYSDARVDEIFASQLTEEAYRRHCSVVIDNNGTIEETIAQTNAAIQTLKKKHIEEKSI